MGSRHLSLRINEETLARLETQGQRSRENVSEIARRLIEEGLRMEAHPGIVFRQGFLERQAALADGPKVWVVARVFRDMTCPREEAIMQTVQLTGLHPHQVDVAMRYYSEYREEIDDWLRAQDEYADEAYAEWQRNQAVLSR
jgi:cyclopropane fatty-acyl-phospholipid synthase-like methyltransferase